MRRNIMIIAISLCVTFFYKALRILFCGQYYLQMFVIVTVEIEVNSINRLDLCNELKLQTNRIGDRGGKG